jgi:hypothetical protein
MEKLPLYPCVTSIIFKNTLEGRNHKCVEVIGRIGYVISRVLYKQNHQNKKCNANFMLCWCQTLLCYLHVFIEITEHYKVNANTLLGLEMRKSKQRN